MFVDLYGPAIDGLLYKTICATLDLSNPWPFRPQPIMTIRIESYAPLRPSGSHGNLDPSRHWPFMQMYPGPCNRPFWASKSALPVPLNLSSRDLNIDPRGPFKLTNPVS